MSRPSALVRRPGPRLAAGLVTHVEREPVDVGRALEQWQHYVSVFESSGWDVVEVPPADDCPDAVFVEDTMVVYGDVAVLALAGAPERRPERAAAEATIGRLGLTAIGVESPGTLDGGDVLKVGTTVYVGRSGRTNAAGVRQLREILTPLGATVVTVPVTRVLHLKSAVTALPDHSVVGYPPLVDDPSFFPSFRPVPEPSGAHVVVLDDSRLLMASDAPRTAELYTDLGFEPVVVDVGEFEKLEGCVTCLSVRLRSGAPDRDVAG